MKNHSELVSIIVPCYNSSKWVRQTISSALAQTYQNIEIIAINDGSTDETQDVLNEFEKSIRIHSHPDRKNHGQSASINLGIRYSRGAYIAFLDSDDLWEPEKIETQVFLLDANPGTAMVYTNGAAINEKSETLYPLFEDHHVERNSPETLLVNCYIRTPSTVMIRRSVVLQTGFFEENLQSSDHDYWLRVIETHQASYIERKLSYYRRHKEQLSGNRRQWEDGFKILTRAKNRYPYSFITTNKRKAVLYYRLASYDLKHKGRTFRTAMLFFASFFHDPFRALKYILERKTK